MKLQQETIVSNSIETETTKYDLQKVIKEGMLKFYKNANLSILSPKVQLQFKQVIYTLENSDENQSQNIKKLHKLENSLSVLLPAIQSFGELNESKIINFDLQQSISLQILKLQEIDIQDIVAKADQIFKDYSTLKELNQILKDLGQCKNITNVKDKNAIATITEQIGLLNFENQSDAAKTFFKKARELQEKYEPQISSSKAKKQTIEALNLALFEFSKSEQGAYIKALIKQCEEPGNTPETYHQILLDLNRIMNPAPVKEVLDLQTFTPDYNIDNAGSLSQVARQNTKENLAAIQNTIEQSKPTELSISQKIFQARKKLIAKFGLGLAVTAAGLSLNNPFKQPEVANIPKPVTQPKTETISSQPAQKIETSGLKNQVEISNQPVVFPSKMVIKTIYPSSLEGTISNSTKFNSDSLLKLLNSYGLDSNSSLKNLIRARGVDQLVESGIIKLSIEKDSLGRDSVEFIVNLESTDFKFSQLKVPEIKTAKQIERDSKDRKTVV